MKSPRFNEQQLQKNQDASISLRRWIKALAACLGR